MSTNRSAVYNKELVESLPLQVSALVVGMLAIEPTLRMPAIEVIAAAAKLCGDRARTGPRFPRPRWTPPPLPDSERFASIKDLAVARKDRS